MWTVEKKGDQLPPKASSIIYSRARQPLIHPSPQQLRTQTPPGGVCRAGCRLSMGSYRQPKQHREQRRAQPASPHGKPWFIIRRDLLPDCLFDTPCPPGAHCRSWKLCFSLRVSLLPGVSTRRNLSMAPQRRYTLRQKASPLITPSAPLDGTAQMVWLTSSFCHSCLLLMRFSHLTWESVCGWELLGFPSPLQ